MCLLCFPALTVLYCLILYKDLKWRIPSVCWLPVNFTGSCRENSESFNIFPYAEKISDEDKDCLSHPFSCSDMHPLPKLNLFSVATHSRATCGATGDHSLASSMFAEMLRCAWGCGIASSKEYCRPSLACLGKIVLGSLMCGGREVC